MSVEFGSVDVASGSSPVEDVGPAVSAVVPGAESVVDPSSGGCVAGTGVVDEPVDDVLGEDVLVDDVPVDDVLVDDVLVEAVLVDDEPPVSGS